MKITQQDSLRFPLISSPIQKARKYLIERIGIDNKNVHNHDDDNGCSCDNIAITTKCGKRQQQEQKELKARNISVDFEKSRCVRRSAVPRFITAAESSDLVC